MDENLSRIVAELFDKSKGGEELSSKIRRLRDEINKVIERDDAIFGKFRALVESFREIIPEEKQRYITAIKALSTTSKLSRQEIVMAVNSQLEELKILEKGLMSAIPGWSDELKIMEAKAQEMRSEITKLREIIGRLEGEEKETLNGMAARKKEMELIEKGVGEVFTVIGAEIAYIKIKVEEFTAETAVAQPIAQGDSTRSVVLDGEKGGDGQQSESSGASAPQNSEFQKKCPMCGGQMNYHSNGEIWQCYSCAHEEKKDESQGKNESGGSSAPQDSEFRKKCPMCGGQMNYQMNGEMWQCYSCAYEEKKGEEPGKSEEKSEQANAPEAAPASDSIFDLAVPLATMSSREYRGSKKEASSPSNSQPSTKKKACPVCRKKMDWHQMDKAWHCPFCGYMRSI